ncbi:MAG: MlaC/ttg2D family ABC transporter substrate-binding protein [Stellaceae bacterium]
MSTVIPSLTRRGAAVWLIALAFVISGTAVRADTEPNARQYIGALVSKALRTLADTKTNEAQREQAFDGMLRENFDFPRISRFVLGRYWSAASEADRAKFIEVYREFIIRSYASQFNEFNGETVKVTNQRAESGDIIVVNSLLVHPNGDPPIKVNWRVHKQGDSFKILDVDIEGISMLLAQREEFASVIQRNGGTVAGLIQAIEEKMKTAGKS